jgi:amino acid transporter
MSLDIDTSSSYSSPWIRKPLSVVQQQQQQPPPEAPLSLEPSSNGSSHALPPQQLLHRHLSVWDLLGIGVGGTVGSGIFVLTGSIAAQYAGRAVALSFLISGLAATCSGVCYAELAARIPAAGATYVYAYVALGEWAAVVAAACLTLEYGVAGAAVARTWGDKVLLLTFSITSDATPTTTRIVNAPAFFLAATSTALLLMGVQESKRVMNVVTLLKMAIVAFMIIGGFLLYDPARVASQPLAPLGVAGIFRGATTSFFGYLGYDEICCVAGEAKHPARDLPRAVLGTLTIVTICYVLAACALTGMVPYNEISPTSGFPDAFHQRHWEWAAHITAAGEVVTLPVVVLISLMAQPRLLLSMTVDGLLPRVFGSVDVHGNLWGGTLISGVAMTTIATLVPFTYLDDLISAGILVAFSMTNSCLVLLRCQSPADHPGLLERLLLIYNALCFLSSMLWSHTWTYLPWPSLLALVSTLATIVCLFFLRKLCPRTTHFGGSIFTTGALNHERHVDASLQEEDEEDETTQNISYFATPMVPTLPCLGMAVNWYLIAQLDLTGIFLLGLYLGLVSLVYLLYCAPHSIGHVRRWSHQRGEYQTVRNHSGDGERELSPIPPDDARNEGSSL